MAKALVGYLGGPTSAQLNEMAQLRRRISDLEAEVGRLKRENDGLSAALSERVDDSAMAELLEVAH